MVLEDIDGENFNEKVSMKTTMSLHIHNANNRTPDSLVFIKKQIILNEKC